MNFIPCVAWVSKGVSASNPQQLHLSPEELKQLVNESRELCGQKPDNEDDSDEEEREMMNSDCEEEDDENENDEEAEVVNENDDDVDDSGDNNEADSPYKTGRKAIVVVDDNDDFDSRYNLDSYDNDDDENPIFTINDLAVHVDNQDDEYISDNESEAELEEKEDFTIKDSDNLLVVGHVEDESSVLDIYVYNQDGDDFYVHHDIVLPSYPLALEWLDFNPSVENPGNYIAVGDMNPVIQIWDLDIVDALEPDFTLGKMPKKGTKKSKTDAHSDAVLSLSWNKLTKTVLASGSADSTIILWDLREGKCLNKLSYHSNKVQALQWHPSESPFLLSGCTDGHLKLYDCRAPDSVSKSWSVDGEIERVAWNLYESFKFLCSTDQGYIHSIDMRHPEIEHSFQAHKESVTGLDISPLHPETLVSASMDKTVKLWDLTDNCKIMKSYKLKVGSIYTARVASDLELTVAVGGNYSSNNLKVLDIYKDITDVADNNESSSKAADCKIDKKFKKQKSENPVSK